MVSLQFEYSDFHSDPVSACSSVMKNALDDYDLDGHILAVFLILMASFIGVLTPIVGGNLIGSRADMMNNSFFQGSKIFGAGVILSTAYIHMFTPAVSLLTHPCLPTFFTKTFTGTAGAIALFGILSVHLIQLLTTCLVQNTRSEASTAAERKPLIPSSSPALLPTLPPSTLPLTSPSPASLHRTPSIDTISPPLSPRSIARSDSGTADIPAGILYHQFSRRNYPRSPSLTLSGSPLLTFTPLPPPQQQTTHQNGSQTLITQSQTQNQSHTHTHSHPLMLQEKHVTAWVLELGMVLHSLFVGITVGVARGNDFESLVIAIGVHQFFEALALSTVVLESGMRGWVGIGMMAGYILMTPFGVALGIGMSEFYDANSRMTLLMTGIFNAFSAGVLGYDALVNIIAPHFKSDVFIGLDGWGRTCQVVCLWSGVIAMGAVGFWA